MKKIYYSLLIVLFSFISCEKVVDVDLTTSEPRLVIEASIQWHNGSNGNEQVVKLSTTSAYFSNEIPPISGATVFITNSVNEVFDFVEDTEPGIYKCLNFNPVVDETYTLTVIHEGETYTSTEKLLDTPTITRIEQDNDGGILGNEIEVKFFFNDLVNQTNFYMVRIDDPYKVIPEFGVIEDRFFQNNEMFGLYFSEDLKPGDTLRCTLNGITLNFYNYMDILLEQTGTNSAGPFSTPTATVRGNIVNQTDFDHFALGYFRLSKTEVSEYVIE